MRKDFSSKSGDFIQNQPTDFVKSKKGFTLVELVVTICILATLAAIALPVIAYTLESSLKSKAKTNAHSIEVAIKEANSLLGAKDSLKYANASSNSIKISEVVKANNIGNAFEPVDVYGTVYYPVMCKGKVYFATDSNGDNSFDKNDKDIDGNNLPDTCVALYDKVNNRIIEDEISNLPLN